MLRCRRIFELPLDYVCSLGDWDFGTFLLIVVLRGFGSIANGVSFLLFSVIMGPFFSFLSSFSFSPSDILRGFYFYFFIYF